MAVDPETHKAGRQGEKKQLSTAGVFFFVVLLMLAAYAVVSVLASDPSEPQKADAGFEVADIDGRAAGEHSQDTAGRKRCEFFVLQKILSAREPMVLDQWEMNGKRVFQMGFTKAGERDQTVRLCVYDPENRSALLPAVADQGQWLPEKSTAAER